MGKGDLIDFCKLWLLIVYKYFCKVMIVQINRMQKNGGEDQQAKPVWIYVEFLVGDNIKSNQNKLSYSLNYF